MSIVEDWLSNEFANEGTRVTYRSALRAYQRALGIEDFSAYLKEKDSKQVLRDIRRFLASMKDRPPKTVTTYIAAVKQFLREHGVDIADAEWKRLRRRGHLPKRAKAATRDRAPTRDEFRKILDYLDVKGRALFLFLASSGCRVGETVQLRIRDLDLDGDPPSAFIRGETTKKEVGERTVYLSFEARDAIRNWVAVKDGLRKRNGRGDYGGPLLFPFTTDTARFMWNRALERAGLAVRDERTNHLELHVHTLRKYFRSNIGLQDDYVHMLMGHVEYLDDAYRRIPWERVAVAYKDAMDRVSVYGSQQMNHRVGVLEDENQRLQTEVELLKRSVENLRMLSTNQQELIQRLASQRANDEKSVES